MDRRRLLGGMGAATATLLAGCSAVLDDGPEGVVLGEQSDQVAESEALAYPAYGQSLPSIELEDPLNGEVIDVKSIDRTMILTAIFTYCPAECGILLNQLAGVQGMIDEAGLTDDVAFLPITFDPERDDAEALADNAETIGADLSLGNWHYLRPETPEEAESLVAEEMGIGFERTTESDRLEDYDFAHPVVTFLANPDAVVERTYRGENIDRNRVVEDTEAVVEAFTDRE
ncbi:SCO family protein [Halorubrum vacuolatum]|uniref:Protein SCO1/2 n=1 Tax=Halorubrum vacuolatum TaxID=63740 RepID=A0A238UVI1_HALVU|nr:SCO family protein [Halorubrum vacuolatum]SNR26235.1 protein SCO1/2 [Halorubrum vacuolatum]